MAILTPHNGPRFQFDPVLDIVPLVVDNGAVAAADNDVDCDFDSDVVVHFDIVDCDFDIDAVVDVGDVGVGDVDVCDSAAIATVVAATAAIADVAHSAVHAVQKHSA